MRTCIVVGGGAAGIFAAIAAAEQDPQAKVILLERTRQYLAKVRISGGGRCNVTHAAFDPRSLVVHYPRGQKELLGPFSRFQPKDTMAWFESRGVPLKIEEDGRVFPQSNSSESIIHCLMSAARNAGVDLRIEQRIERIERQGEQFIIVFENADKLIGDRLLLATGSSPQGHALAQSLGHTLVPPVPSLFTFNIPSSPLHDLAGISLPHVGVQLPAYRFSQEGPFLITHWGFSGPAVLKLSAHAARELHRDQYLTDVIIQWVPGTSTEALYQQLIALKEQHPSKCLEQLSPFKLPTNLWKRLVQLAFIGEATPLSRLSHPHLKKLADLCHAHPFKMEGKTTHKQEFVTCGGVALSEIHFQRMESRITSHLYFAGEILDIDGVTGGFNFQHAWTSGWLAGHAMTS